MTPNARSMNVQHWPSLVRFAPEKMQKVNLFETDRFFMDLYCLLPGQEQKPHVHELQDKVYLVLEGAVTARVAEHEQALGQGMSVLAPAGRSHGVRNDSGRPAVLLVTMAPHPSR